MSVLRISIIVLLLCVSICVQMPGIAGTLFDFSVDTTDVFQSSVITGYTITSNPSLLVPALTSKTKFIEPPIRYVFVSLDAPFHPPMAFFS